MGPSVLSCHGLWTELPASHHRHFMFSFMSFLLSALHNLLSSLHGAARTFHSREGQMLQLLTEQHLSSYPHIIPGVTLAEPPHLSKPDFPPL